MTQDDKDYQAKVSRYARLLRAAYATLFQVRTGRQYRPNPRAAGSGVWERVARTCIRLNAYPEHFMQAQFEFARSLPIPNTLHADTACKNYSRYRATTLYLDSPTENEVDTCVRMSPGATLLKSKQADTVAHMHSLIGKTDMHDAEVQEFVCNNPWHFDPFSIILLCPTQPYVDVFGRGALEQMENRPELEQALRDDESLHPVITCLYGLKENNA